MKSLFILSVGGSMIVNAQGINIPFLKAFAAMIRRRVKAGNRFVIVTGGGATAREYIRAGSEIRHMDHEDLDWLGIHATRLNAHLMRSIFRDIAYPVVVKNPTRAIRLWKQPVLIGAGWKPGRSTDHGATMLAKKLGGKIVVNISNVDFLYDADPRKNGNAKPVKEMSWAQYRKMVGETWDPGMNLPFDPVASKLAHASKISVYLVGGTDMKNIERIFQGKSWKGSILKNMVTW